MGTRPRRVPQLPRIVFEDEDVLVVDKPAGMLSARPRPDQRGGAAQGARGGTDRGREPRGAADAGEPGVLEWLRERAPRPAGRGREPQGPWLVHRLDRDTSGLLAFARSQRAFHWLKDDLRARRIERRYVALVRGELEPGRTGQIESYLSTAPGPVRSIPAERFRGRAPGPGGEPAEARFARTRYRVLAAGRGYSLLELALESGRRHQIRVHLHELGHPVVGDRSYGGERAPRLWLHACSLAFEHPADGSRVALYSPLPAAMCEWSGAAPEELRRAMQGEAGERPAGTGDVRAGRERSAGAEAVAVRGDRMGAVAPEAERARGRERAPAAATSWEPVADWYDQLLDERRSDHYRDVVLPGALRLLGAAPGSRVLDIACGQGALCRELAQRGVRVLGIDASPRLLELARRRGASPGENAPQYLLLDARELGVLARGDGGPARAAAAARAAQPGAPLLPRRERRRAAREAAAAGALGGQGSLRPPFDGASCVLALDNIDPLEPLFEGAARCLRPGAPLVLVILHPAFRAPRQSSWGWDRDEAGRPRQYRRVDGYLSPGRVRIVANPGGVAAGEKPIETWTFHRPLEHYVRALAEAGFAIERLEEWTSLRSSQPGPRAAEENRARREIPLFLGLRARLLGSAAGEGAP